MSVAASLLDQIRAASNDSPPADWGECADVATIAHACGWPEDGARVTAVRRLGAAGKIRCKAIRNGKNRKSIVYCLADVLAAMKRGEL